MEKIQGLSDLAFAPYGQIIAHNMSNEASFQVVLSEPDSKGWRIAVNRPSQDAVKVFGCHPNTRESFEPVSGICVLFVAKHETPEQWEAFLLNQPVCLYRGIWHATVALSEGAILKITENNQVESMEYPLVKQLSIGIKEELNI